MRGAVKPAPPSRLGEGPGERVLWFQQDPSRSNPGFAGARSPYRAARINARISFAAAGILVPGPKIAFTPWS